MILGFVNTAQNLRDVALLFESSTSDELDTTAFVGSLDFRCTTFNLQLTFIQNSIAKHSLVLFD